MGSPFNEGLDTMERLVADHLASLGLHPSAKALDEEEYNEKLARFKTRIPRFSSSVRESYNTLADTYLRGTQDESVKARLEELKLLLKNAESGNA